MANLDGGIRESSTPLGAWPTADGTNFRVWAPKAQTIEVVGTGVAGRMFAHPLTRSDDGFFTAFVKGVSAGDRYRYRVNGGDAFPDPASRYQPEGVHGPSEIIDPHRFCWSDAAWRGIALEDAIFYELHVGTFTSEGTFAAARERLSYLVDLGITAVELLPLAQCPGQRNWGYDGVDLFAPAHAYGHPDDLRRFVDDAHRLGLAVILDVVYNHLGPDGNYLGIYSSHYANDRHHTDWGEAHNFDGEASEHVREFFIENAIHWIDEYHFDGLRLDATHIMRDESPRHILAELAARVRAAAPRRQILVIAEDYRNLAAMYRPVRAGGWGLDAVWADSFHHQLRRFFTGDHEGHFRDYTGTIADLATTIRRGWFYCGQHSEEFGGPHGTDPTAMSYPQFIVALQNHDQIGNRATGDRLNHAIEPAAYRAATALLLGGPLTPLLFMGQEWAATTPFQFFTDHHEDLGRLVTAGRRNEFRHFAAFADPAAQEQIPDPQAIETFLASKLNWDEITKPEHASMLRLYRRLLHLRRTEPALRSTARAGVAIEALDEATILMCRLGASPPLLFVVRLRGAGHIDLAGRLPPTLADFRWEIVLTTEDDSFTMEANRPTVDLSANAPAIAFAGAAAVILRATR